MKNKNLNNINTTGFNIPKDYFEIFENQLLNKINAEETVLNVKSTGFKTPKDYFNNIEDGVFVKLSEEKNTKVISLFNRKTIVYVAGIAAAIVLCFNLSMFDSTIAFEDLEAATVESYILEDDINSYEIAALLTEEELNESTIITHDFQDETIEEYLLNNADIEALIVE